MWQIAIDCSVEESQWSDHFCGEEGCHTGEFEDVTLENKDVTLENLQFIGVLN